jgi:GNAT superfamily N-acetyltransferase
MRLVVRQAARSDVTALENAMGRFLGRSAEDLKARGLSVIETIDSTSNVIVLAEVDDTLVGFGTASIRRVARYRDPIAEIDELFVEPAYRRKGVARVLVDQILAISRRSGCRRTFVASNSARTEAAEFYSRVGFDRYGLHFRRDMTG